MLQLTRRQLIDYANRVDNSTIKDAFIALIDGAYNVADDKITNSGGIGNIETEEFNFDLAITSWLLDHGAAPSKVLSYNGTEFLFIDAAGVIEPEPTTVVFTNDTVSEVFSTPTGGTLTHNVQTVPSPVSGMPVDMFLGGGGNYAGLMRHNMTLTDGSTYKLVVYLRKGTYDLVGVGISGGIINENYPFINLTDFTVNNLDLDNVTCTVEELSDEWCKFSIKVTMATSTRPFIDISLVGSAGQSSYNPNTSSTIYIARPTFLTT